MDSYLTLLFLFYWQGIDAKKKNSVSIVFGGDVDFSRLTRYTHHAKNCSYDESLRRLKKYFKSADFAMINLETTIGKPYEEVNPNTQTGLWSEEAVLPALKDVGIEYVTIANNHISDFRELATNKTIAFLQRYGIHYSGIVFGPDRYAKQEPLILEKNGLKIGILSYCDLSRCEDNWVNRNSGPPLFKVENVLDEVATLKLQDQCDIVILFLHWGFEFGSIINAGVVGIVKDLTKRKDLSKDRQIDLIVGSHPHVTQKHFYTKKTLVVTSLGNLFFTPYGLANFNFNPKENTKNLAYYEKIWYKQMQVMDDGTQHGRLLKVKFNKNGIIKRRSKYIPTRIFATKKHCLATKKEDNAKWQPICGDGDPECTGTPTCNYIECDEGEPLPGNLGASPNDNEEEERIRRKNTNIKHGI